MWWPSKHLLLELGCVPPSIHMKEAYQDMKCWGHTLGWDKALGLPLTEAIDYLTGIHIQVDSLSFEPRLETHSIEWHQHLEWWFCITASPRNDLSLRLWCVSCRSQAYCIDRVLNWGSRREYLFLWGSMCCLQRHIQWKSNKNHRKSQVFTGFQLVSMDFIQWNARHLDRSMCWHREAVAPANTRSPSGDSWAHLPPWWDCVFRYTNGKGWQTK